MFSRLFRYCRPAECIQFYEKSNHILYEQIVSSSIVVLKCVQPSVRSQRITLILAHANRITLTAVHKIGSNWLTQEVCYDVGRHLNKLLRLT